MPTLMAMSTVMKSKQRNQLRPHFFKKARHWRAFYLWGEE
jgi:hypothetical protein